MNQTESGKPDDRIKQGAVESQRTAARRAKSDRQAGQLLATLWIVAAWLVGTLISELTVMGEEPGRATTSRLRSGQPETIIQQWQHWETEFALAFGGLDAFDRLARNSQLSGVDSISAAQTQAAARTSAPSTDDSAIAITAACLRPVAGVARRCGSDVELAFNLQLDAPQPSPLRLAWSEFDGDSLLGHVDQAAHSYEELLPPVNVQVLNATDQSLQLAEPSSGAEDVILVVDAELRDPNASIDVPESPVEEVAEIPRTLTEATATRIRPLRPQRLGNRPLPPRTDDQGWGGPTNPEPTAQSAARQSSRQAGVQRGDRQPSRPEASAYGLAEVSEEPDSSAQRWGVPSEAAPARRGPLQSDRADLILARKFLAGIAPSDDNLPTATPVVEESRQQPPANIAPPRANPPVGLGLVQEVLRQSRLAAKWPLDHIESDSANNVKLNVDGFDVRTVFEMLARGYQMNILVAPDVTGTVTATVEGLTPEQTLQGIVKMCNLSMQQEGELIYIYPADKVPSDRRQLRVFTLDFARAESLESTVQGLLSPVGNAYSSTMSESDNMQTQESIVVVDIPSVVSQVEEYILQADRAPRQVMIEAKILEVELSDEMIHGIDYRAILSGDVATGAIGFGPLLDAITTSNPLFYGQVDGTDLNALIQLLETTLDSKTLASPRVHVLNGQNARIQVGQQLGFSVATVTQTSTIQDVQFLETGVVLSVTPTISRDNRVLMKVKPEISDGEINPTTQRPEKETREVETSVLLDNHQGMIIGGLIQEKDRTVIKKLPWLGDLKYVGKIFQQRQAERSRTEIIVVLVPHIVESGVMDERSQVEYQRADTPLYHGLLQRNCRPWEPRMPDVAAEHDHMDVNQINRSLP